jgi:hypothetical protein
MDFIKKNIYYLTMEELKSIADTYNIPVHIYIEKKEGYYVKTSQVDRKRKIIKRILTYLKTGKINKPTIYTKKVVNLYNNNNLTAISKVYYGQYKNGNQKILKLMKQLTNNLFEFGAVSCLILNKYWEKQIAPTYKEFAKEYVRVSKKETSHPEWKYIEFMRIVGDRKQWHSIREKIAKKILRLIQKS